MQTLAGTKALARLRTLALVGVGSGLVELIVGKAMLCCGRY